MSDPLNEHLSTLMSGPTPTEAELRKMHAKGIAAAETEEKEEEEGVEAPSGEETDESSDDDSVSEQDEEDDDEEDEDDDDDEPMTPEQLQAALKQAEADRDSARVEADGRLKALTTQRGSASELKTEIESLKEMVKGVIPEKPEAPPAPDKEEDPLGYVAWQQEHVVSPLVETVETLQNSFQSLQFNAMLNEIEGGVNANISQGIGKDKVKEKKFIDARDFMVSGYKKHFMEKEGDNEQTAMQKVRVIAAQAGANILQAGGNFADLVIEEATKAGWKPATDDPIRKVKKGQKTNKMEAGGPSKQNRRRGRKVTSAMMESQDMDHGEKLAIIGNDTHRRNLIEKGYTHIQNE